MRYFIHLSHYAKKRGITFSFESYFGSQNYEEFKSFLEGDDLIKCETVTAGSIFIGEANGLIFDTEFSICSVCSIALREFTLFMGLALLSFEKEVPKDVRNRALMIATRIMLDCEAYDFKMDPRGIIPKEIEDYCNKLFNFQAVFLAGHEYSHLLLGHLDKSKQKEVKLVRPYFSDNTDYRKIHGYTFEQKQEFSADLLAMQKVHETAPASYYDSYYLAATIWLAFLAISEAALDFIEPPYGHQTHPGAKARYANLIENAPKPANFDEAYYCNEIPAMIENKRKYIIEALQYDFDTITIYGSFYLAAPNTEWRGKELIDRVDF